ncbi:membrane trafficking regulatory protein [Lithospermum erythrorhizon]|uniref:Membrane trafficking regulatory protein n=1 Tax=Lithospermum erythrorhizon TaxID=34254 RepID=A0AAV3R7A5_LITER
MSTTGLLNIEPLELKFPLELRKQVSCTLQVSNKSQNNVAFKVKTTNPKKYCVRPNTGIVLPQSTCDIIVTMQAQKELPADFNCKDKFLLQSVIASPGATPKDITSDMFTKDSGNVVDECKLRVIYLPPAQPPSPVAEGSEDDSSPKASSDTEARKYVDSNDRSSEARPLSSRLSEERAAALQQANRLRQELELLRRDSNKTQGGFSSTVVIIIGLVGLVIGYLIKRS